jgi:HK97 family phage prohead protease
MQKLKVPLEIKSLSEREFTGYGSIFGNTDLGGDVVMKGAFKGSLARQKKNNTLPLMFWGHNPDQVPGKWLDMREDNDGLVARGVLADTPLGNEIHTLLKMEAVRGLSIGYVTKDQDFTDDGVRLIKEVELMELSIVSMPMNPLAQIEHVKSRLSKAGEYVPTVREIENIWRDAGCSKSTARKMVAMYRSYEETGEMPVESPLVTDEEEAVAALKALADSITATTIRQITKKVFT